MRFQVQFLRPLAAGQFRAAVYWRRNHRDGRAERRRFSRAGFSLIELLIVMGVMVALLGGTAIALAGRGGEGSALVNAQSLIAGLVGATRAQAALHQTRARLIVYAQMPPAGDAAKYLRSLQIVREETLANGSTIWVAVGDPVSLPAPICVVPPSPVPTNHLRLPAGQAWNNNPATGPVSTLTIATGFNYRGQVGATLSQFFGVQGQSGRMFYLQMDHTGAIESPTPGATPTKIALATALLSGSSVPLFNNGSGVRGVVIRRSGSITLVDEATGF